MALSKKTFPKAAAAAAAFDPYANFETVTYTGNGGTQKITGYIRKGAAFNGSSSYIDTALNISNIVSNINDRTQDFSFSCWVNINSATNVGEIIYFGNGTTYSPNYHGISLGFNNGTLKFEIFDGTTAHNINTTISANSWYNIVCVRESSIMKLYVNNSFIGQTTQTNNSSISTSTVLRLGANINSAYYFNGKLDQVRIFNKALSSSEVTTLYGETYASSTKSTTDIFGDGSGVALYELDDSANDTAGVSGKFGSAAIFNGSSSKIYNTNISSGNSFSISTWFNTTRVDSNGQTIFALGWDEGGTDRVAVQINTGNPSNLAIYATNSGGWSGISNSISVNTWHHLVIAYNSSATETKCYLDGSLAFTDTRTITNSGVKTLSLSTFGIDGGNATAGYFSGKIDDFRLYSDELTSTEVGYIYNNTTASIPTDNLVAYYKLDGDATDETGTYNGTATNVSYAYNGTATNVNYLGMAFQPDFVWTKPRSYADNHQLWDTIRGAGWTVYSNSTNAQNPTIRLDGLSSFDSNGFTIGNWNNINVANETYVAWCWKAGGSAVSNTDGTLTSQVSANQAAGFSIVSYTGGGTSNYTVGHGLSSAPELIIVKNRDQADGWLVWTTIIDGSSDYLFLNSTGAKGDSGQSLPTSTVVEVQADGGGESNTLNEKYIMYCFHSVSGYQKVGSYTGTGTSGNIVTTGFQPRFVMIKNTSSASTNWILIDSLRENGDKWLYPNVSNAEYDDGNTYTELNSNGFTVNDSASYVNANNDIYIYLAIA